MYYIGNEDHYSRNIKRITKGKSYKVDKDNFFKKDCNSKANYRLYWDLLDLPIITPQSWYKLKNMFL